MAKISHVDQLLDRWILEWQNALQEEKEALEICDDRERTRS